MSVDAGLRRLFRAHLPLVDFVTVESSRTGRGVPDTNYCVAGCEGWIEFKAATGWRVAIRPEQVGWAERRMERGGRVLLAVRKVTYLILFSGDKMRRLRDERFTNVESLGEWDGGSSGWDWDEVLAILMSQPCANPAGSSSAVSR